MIENLETQSRMKSPLFWIGMFACVFEAVLNSLVSSGIELPAWLPAIGVALTTVLIY